MRTLYQDLRYTLRQLREAPVYALTAILTLALGLGAATAMLAIIDSVLIRPVPLPHPDRLVTLATSDQGQLRPGDIEVLRANVKSFASLAAYGSLPEPVTTPEGTRITLSLTVLPGFFDVPSVPAGQGRLPTRKDSGTSWAVISNAFWRDNLHGNPHTVGSRITVENRPLTVIGILSPGFKFPGSMTGALVFIPSLLDAKGRDANGLFGTSSVVVRLTPGVPPAAALAEARAVYTHLPPSKDYTRGRLIMAPYRDSIVGDIQPALFALLGACFVLLTIACVNSANLQIARATQRLPEIGIRAALGATRGRLFRQLVTESVTISLLGAALGLVLAASTLKALRAAYGLQFTRFDELAIHPAGFAACALLAVLTGILAALAPAWGALRTAGGTPLSQATRVTRRSRLSSGLVTLEVALTCTLLITAGLFLRTFRALEAVPLGFRPHHVTEMTLMPLNPKEDNAALKQTHERLLARLDSLPGVEAAAAQVALPFSSFSLAIDAGFRVTGHPARKGDQTLLSFLSPGYVQTMGAPLLEGRGFISTDTPGSQLVGMVNQTFARQFLKGQRATGRSIEFTVDSTDGSDDRILKSPIAIVGVLADQAGKLGTQPDPMLFLPYAQFPVTGNLAHLIFGLAPQFAVRSTLPQTTLERELRLALKQAAPNMAEMQIAPLDANIAASLTRQRLALRLASAFGLLALVLAAVGIYGVLSSSVAQRTRELGIRLALGSPRRTAMLLILKQAGSMVALGLAAGLLCAWPAGRAMRAFLYGVTPLDPFTLAAATLALLLIALAAAAIPAWRATQIDPIEALRAE